MPRALDANARQYSRNGRPILVKTTPTAVAARYDRRVGRVVIALSNRLEVGFKPMMSKGWKPHARRNWLESKYHRRAWVCTFRSWMLICTCLHYCKAFWAPASGWLKPWARLAARQLLLRKRTQPALMVVWVDGHARFGRLRRLEVGAATCVAKVGHLFSPSSRRARAFGLSAE